jgi:exodeoxyribonuclease V beta subunit
MKPSFHSLDPLSLPLAGSGLIEASAGTGKTYTIAALYVRLVLGLSCTARVPAEILVMTFTKAATRELAERIRSRLLEVARVLGGEAPAAEDRARPDAGHPCRTRSRGGHLAPGSGG